MVVELSTNECEDDLFSVFKEDGMHIGEVMVGMNPIMEQRMGTLETHLPQTEEYPKEVRRIMSRRRAKRRIAGRCRYKKQGISARIAAEIPCFFWKHSICSMASGNCGKIKNNALCGALFL